MLKVERLVEDEKLERQAAAERADEEEREMREAIERCAIPSAAHSVVVRVGSLADRADVVGALALADLAREAGARTGIAAG